MINTLKRIDNQELIFYGMFFLPLIGSSIVAYIYVLLFFLFQLIQQRVRYTKRGLIVGISVTFFCLLKFFQMGNLYDWSVIVRYYFGWALFLYYLDAKNFRLDSFDLFLKLILFEILAETVLINTIVSPTLLPNYPHHEFAVDFETVLSTVGYQRPYSFGCNATVTSTILCMLFATRDIFVKYGVLEKNNKIEIVGAVAMVLLASGTGLFLYILYMAYKYRNIFNIRSVLMVVSMVVIFVVVLSNTAIGETILFRFGTDALYEMYDFKIEEIDYYVQMTLGETSLIGVNFKNIPLLTQGDLAWVELYYSIGIVGVAIFLLFITKYSNRINQFPILLGLIGAVHYAGILSEPGQLILAYLAIINSNYITSQSEEIWEMNTEYQY